MLFKAERFHFKIVMEKGYLGAKFSDKVLNTCSGQLMIPEAITGL
jgi:hypothetical protein